VLVSACRPPPHHAHARLLGWQASRIAASNSTRRTWSFISRSLSYAAMLSLVNQPHRNRRCSELCSVALIAWCLSMVEAKLAADSISLMRTNGAAEVNFTARRIWFLTPAKTGSRSLVEKLRKTQASCPGRLRWNLNGDHMITKPPPGFEGAIVLRSPLERFVSAYEFATERYTAQTQANASLLKALLANASLLKAAMGMRMSETMDLITMIGQTSPTAARMQRLVAANSSLNFARWLSRDAQHRAVWLSAPEPGVYHPSHITPLSIASPAACLFPCGMLCGFVPQAIYARHAKHVACLSRLDSDVQQILDIGRTGCVTPNVSEHVNAAAKPSTHGTHEAETAELQSHVMRLYAIDWQLWERWCETPQHGLLHV